MDRPACVLPVVSLWPLICKLKSGAALLETPGKDKDDMNEDGMSFVERRMPVPHSGDEESDQDQDTDEENDGTGAHLKIVRSNATTLIVAVSD
jgi:hypothetical protein